MRARRNQGGRRGPALPANLQSRLQSDQERVRQLKALLRAKTERTTAAALWDTLDSVLSTSSRRPNAPTTSMPPDMTQIKQDVVWCR